MDELKNLVIQTLETNGILGQIRTKLRSSVFKVIDNNDPTGKERAMHWENPLAQKVLDTAESALAADLIREYLEFYRLDYTLSIFIPEGNLKQDPIDKNDLLNRSEVDHPTDSEPLLVQVLKERKSGSSNPPRRDISKPVEKKSAFVASQPPQDEKVKVKEQEKDTRASKYSSSNQGLSSKPVIEENKASPSPMKAKNVQLNPIHAQTKDLTDSNDYDDDFGDDDDEDEDDEIEEMLPVDDMDNHADDNENKMFSESGNAFTGSQSMGLDPSVNTLAMDEYDHVEEVIRYT